MNSYEEAYADFPKHLEIKQRYDEVQVVGLDAPTEIQGKRNALITYQLFSCLGVTVSSVADKVARMVHINTAEQPMLRMQDFCDFVNDAEKDLDKPELKIVSPCLVNNSMMPLIEEMRKMIRSMSDKIYQRDLIYLDPGYGVNFVAVGTDGEHFVDTVKLNPKKRLHTLLYHELSCIVSEYKMPIHPMQVFQLVGSIQDVGMLDALVNNPDDRAKEEAYKKLLMEVVRRDLEQFC